MKQQKRQLSIADQFRSFELGEQRQYDVVDYPVSGLRSTKHRIEKELGVKFEVKIKAGIRYATVERVL